MYKLKNIKTGKEHLCDKVIRDGFDYYVTDDKPKLGEFYIDDNNEIRQAVTDDEEYWDRRTGYKKLITTNNPIINVPQIVDEAEMLGHEFLKERGLKENSISLSPFIIGYNKAKEEFGNSDKDMIEFAEWAVRRDRKDISLLFRKSKEELLQIWKEQQPKIVYYNE